MKGIGYPWLTTVLRNPHTLSESSSLSPSTFPIKRRQYPCGSPKFPIPKMPEATHDIHAVINATLLVGLTAGQSRWLWDDFFTNPGMLAEVVTSSADQEKVPVAIKEDQELRRVALCSVYRHPDEVATDRARLAVLGQLTILKDRSRNTALSSWFEASLHTTTRSLQLGLESISGIRVEGAAGAQRLQIVIAEEFVEDFESARRSLERSAWVAGIHPEFLLADKSRYENTKASLSTKATNRALFIGNLLNTSLYDSFILARGTESAVQFDTGLKLGTNDFLSAFRETAARLAGFDGDLKLRMTPLAPSREGRPKIPIQSPEKCLHNGNFVYVYDRSTELWWTRDLAGHGGSVFKTYTQEGKILYHQSERDAEGHVIADKHKGPTNISVQMNDLASCGLITQKDHLL